MKFATVFLLLLVVCSCQAQTTHRNILGTRYSLAAVQRALIAKEVYRPYPQTPEAWKSAVPESVIRDVIKTAEQGLSYRFEGVSASIALDFVRSGDRERHSTISFKKRDVLTELILAESMEGKGRFIEAILNGVWSICEESYWGVPAHIGHTGLPDVENPVVDLFTAETAAVLALADYFVGDALDKISPLVRQRIYYETNQRFFSPMLLKGGGYRWMSKVDPVSNWNPWIMSNWMLSNLLLEKDAERRVAMLYSAIKGLDLYFNGLGDDGGCEEGPTYWFAAGGSVFDALDLLQSSTNGLVNIYDVSLVAKMASYVYKAHIDGYYFTNFSDADPILRPDGLMLYRFGVALKDEQLQRFGGWAFGLFPNTSVSGFQRMRRVGNLLAVRRMSGASAYVPLKDSWLSDIQMMTARTANGLYLASHGGHNGESHNHNDVGDFIVYADGQPMIIDVGRGNYTARTFSKDRYELWYAESRYHNLPIVNGFGQQGGRHYRASNVRSEINEREAVLRMDIAAAYPEKAGIRAWHREVMLDRIKNQVQLSEEYVLEKKPQSLQQVFMTVGKVDISQPGKIILVGDKGVALQINYDPTAWGVSSSFPSVAGPEYSSLSDKWANKQLQRIVLSSKKAEAAGQYSFTIEKKS